MPAQVELHTNLMKHQLGKKRPGDATTSQVHDTDLEMLAEAQALVDPPVGRERTDRGYRTGPGSFYYLMFGDDHPFPDLNQEYIPEMNIPEMNVQEMQLSQNAPSLDDI
jgi:hypothetical protein